MTEDGSSAALHDVKKIRTKITLDCKPVSLTILCFLRKSTCLLFYFIYT